MNLIKAFLHLYVEPAKGFREALAARPWTFVIPLLAVIGATFLLNAYYYHHVDLPWLKDQLTVAVDPKQRDALQQAMTPARLLIVSLVGITLLTCIVDVVRSMFFWLVLKVQGNRLEFRKLFAITTWAAVPLLLLLPAGIVNLHLGGATHVAPNDVNPVSFNQLFFHFPSAAGWGNMLSTISIVSLWEVVLLAVGLRTIAGVSTRTAIVLAVLPDLVVYGIWMLTLMGHGHS